MFIVFASSRILKYSDIRRFSNFPLAKVWWQCYVYEMLVFMLSITCSINLDIVSCTVNETWKNTWIVASNNAGGPFVNSNISDNKIIPFYLSFTKLVIFLLFHKARLKQDNLSSTSKIRMQLWLLIYSWTSYWKLV